MNNLKDWIIRKYYNLLSADKEIVDKERIIHGKLKLKSIITTDRFDFMVRLSNLFVANLIRQEIK